VISGSRWDPGLFSGSGVGLVLFFGVSWGRGAKDESGSRTREEDLALCWVQGGFWSGKK
jgi:hypothetical protein